MKKTLKFISIVFAVMSFSLSANSVTELTPENIEQSPRQLLELNLNNELGNVVYIDFWASWCVPCLKSFPWMNDIQKKYKDKGFTVISINVDADKTEADKFLTENPASFKVIYDSEGTLAKHFSIQGMPSSMLVNRDGNIIYRHSGFFTSKIEQYETEIQQLLNSSMTTTEQ